MNTRRRIISVLITLVMIFASVPSGIFAMAEGNENSEGTKAGASYNLWIGNTQVTDANKDDILNQKGDDNKATASYDPDTKTLTLNNPVIAENAQYNEYKIYSLDSLVITGKANITGYKGIMVESKVQELNTLTFKKAYINVSTEYESILARNTHVYMNSGKLDLYSSTFRTVNIQVHGSLFVNGGEIIAKTDSTGREAIVVWRGNDVEYVPGENNITITGGRIDVTSSGNAPITSAGVITFPSGYHAHFYGSTDSLNLNNTHQYFINSGMEKITNGRIIIEPDLSHSLLSFEVEPEEGGEASGGGLFKTGSEVTVTAKANDGYAFDGWEVNGEIVSTDTEYTFTLTESIKIRAKFSVGEIYGVYVQGIQITSVNKGDVLGDGKVSFVPAANNKTAVLKLNNAVIGAGPRPDATSNNKANIFSYENLIIELTGENTLSFGTTESITTHAGICLDEHKELVIEGFGELNLIGNSSAYNTFGVITGLIRILGGKVSISGSEIGIYAKSGNFLMNGGELFISSKKECISSVGLVKVMDGALEISSANRKAIKASSTAFDSTVYVDTDPSGEKAEIWNGETLLEIYKYVRVDRATYYDVWVQGIRITSINKDDVLGDGTGSVSYKPKTESDLPMLVFSDAKISGAPNPDNSIHTTAIIIRENIDLQLNGENTISIKKADEGFATGIDAYGYSMYISGEGSLELKSEKARYNTVGIDADFICMLSGDITLTSKEDAPFTFGICSDSGLEIYDGTLTAAATDSPFYVIKNFIYMGGTIEAISLDEAGGIAIKKVSPDYSGYSGEMEILVNTTGSSSGAYEWDEEYSLGGYTSAYKYVKISSVTYYDLWVGGVRVSSKNKKNVLDKKNSKGIPTVVFKEDRKSGEIILALNDAEIVAEDYLINPTNKGKNGIVSTIPALIIELNGNNKIDFGNYEGNYHTETGINVSGNLIIKGEGSLEIRRDENAPYVSYYTGIKSKGILEIQDGNLDLFGGNKVYVGIGLVADNALQISGGNIRTVVTEFSMKCNQRPVLIKGGTVEAFAYEYSALGIVNIDDYLPEPDVLVSKVPFPGEKDIEIWNGKDILGGPDSEFSYVKISPSKPTTVTVNLTPSGAGTVSGGGTYNRGDSVTVAATPRQGYSFVCWKENGKKVSADAKYTFRAGKERITLVAEFERQKFEIVFVNIDDTVLQRTMVNYGETPKYNGKTPVFKRDDKNFYIFTGWKPAIKPATAPEKYIAVYSARALPKITTQPKSTTVYMGETVKVTVKASGDNLTYLWYYNDGKGFVKSGQKTNTYSVTMSKEVSGRKLYCLVTDKYGNQVKSQQVTITGKNREQDNPNTEKVPMYRLYNPNSGEHFYTGSLAERNGLMKVGWKYEGIGWNAPKKSNTPVYRLYNENAGDHHYTMNIKERDWLISLGWNYEGIGWYSDDNKGVPLYRQYNPNAVTGSHNYTTSRSENDWLVSLGWIAEGIGWYGMK